MEEEVERPAVVIDSGSQTIKAGFSGEDVPKLVFPTLIGTPKNLTGDRMLGDGKQDTHFIGNEAETRRGILSLQHPLQHGIVRDWDSMEKIWQAVYSELRVSGAEQAVLMTEPPLNPVANRENMTQMLFEKFDVPAFYVMTQGVLSHMASGRHMGVMLDCGHGVTHIMPIEGLYVRSHAIERVNVAGEELTSYLQLLLLERGYNFPHPASVEMLREVKEKLCYVAQDYQQELAKASLSPSLEKDYLLPDGQVITLNDHRFRVPEALFQPKLLGLDQVGIQALVMKSIMKCDIDVRATFYNNVILCGGSTMFPGFGERLKRELTALAPASQRIGVVEAADKKYYVWTGGSILASLSVFRQMWIRKQEYEEYGPNIVHRKCS